LLENGLQWTPLAYLQGLQPWGAHSACVLLQLPTFKSSFFFVLFYFIAYLLSCVFVSLSLLPVRKQQALEVRQQKQRPKQISGTTTSIYMTLGNGLTFFCNLVASSVKWI
jgi:1,4-dihydroxy-2-naphthoate octaprenyltransferase